MKNAKTEYSIIEKVECKAPINPDISVRQLNRILTKSEKWFEKHGFTYEEHTIEGSVLTLVGYRNLRTVTV